MYEIKIFRLVTFVTNLKHRVQFVTVKLPHAFKATCPVTDKSIIAHYPINTTRALSS